MVLYLGPVNWGFAVFNFQGFTVSHYAYDGNPNILKLLML